MRSHDDYEPPSALARGWDGPQAGPGAAGADPRLREALAHAPFPQEAAELAARRRQLSRERPLA